ncbi:MAG: ROK family protein [Nocardiopsaceae bacterium]|nr:ROK family protein [Nocardiopsaceae bacterium]
MAAADDLAAVLALVRSGRARTRLELSRQGMLGRTVIAQRVAQLIDMGLVSEGQLGQSTGGRAPRQLDFRAAAGTLLLADFGATSLSAGVSDLSGGLAARHEERFDIAAGPERALSRLVTVFDRLLAEAGRQASGVWGVGVGVPGPVEFSTGEPISPPIMPGWDGYPIRRQLAGQYGAPVWVDNDVNLMALGELSAGSARGEQQVVFVKIGTGIGAGLISAGKLHRGAQGCAGDVGHVAVGGHPDVICRCGNRGCLEAMAGGAALGRDGAEAARAGRSDRLAAVLAGGRDVRADDVAQAANCGDPVGVELLVRAGRMIGEVLASIVNFYNPSLILIGGGVARAGDLLLASIREAVYRRSLPLATRDLRIELSALGDRAGLLGAASMVTEELFAPARLARWLDRGSPAGMPGLPDAAT